MKNKNYTLRKAELKDYDEYLAIRSEEKNLHWTGYSDPPDYQKFYSWYQNRLADPNRHIYLMFEKRECVGSLNIDYYPDYTAIGYSVRTPHEGKGIATEIVRKAIELISTQNNKINKIIAWINSNNIASIRVAEKNGFAKTEYEEIRKRFGNDELYFEYKLHIQ